MRKIFVIILLLFTLICIICVNSREKNTYSSNEFKNFYDYINLTEAVQIESSHPTKYSNNKYIYSLTDINEIVNYLYKISLTPMKKSDVLPNESPEVYLIFKDKNEKEIAYLMIYSGGYIVDITTGERYKIMEESFTMNFITWLGIWK